MTSVTAYRPAGMSDDEDFSDDYDDFGDLRPRREHWSYQANVELTPEDCLLNAVKENDIDKVKECLEKNASPDYKRGDGIWTPFMEACQNANFEIVKLLLANGANVNDARNSYRPIHCLCNSSSDEDSIMMCFNLLKHAELDISDWYGVTPLMLAAKQNHIQLAKELLNYNSINAKNNEGWTALFYAVDSCHIEMVNFLKRHKANLKFIDKRNYTVQEMAAQRQNKELEECVKIGKDYEGDELRISIKSTCQMMILECPDKSKGRLYGFQSSAVNYLIGLELNHLIKPFSENNLQLGHLLTWNNEELQKFVKFSFDRKKLISCVKEYHEGRWENKTLTPLSTNDPILLKTVKELANLNRVIYLMSISTFYCYKNYKKGPKLEADFNKMLLNIEYLKTYLEEISAMAQKINGRDTKPADFISPRVSLWQKVKSNVFKFWPHCLFFNLMWIIVHNYKRKYL